jgi:replicative DNA helicase
MELGSQDSARIHLDTINDLKENTKEDPMVQEEALNFCKQQNLKKEIKNVSTIIENGKFQEYHKIEGIIQRALRVGLPPDETIDVFQNIDQALEKDSRCPIPTGISGLDHALKGGLGRGELGVILAPTGTGKALPISEPVLTPNGWVENGSLSNGDMVIGSDGKSQYVLGVYPQGIRPIYKVEFTDGTHVNCDSEHLWNVNTLNMRESKTRVKGKSVYKPNNGYVTMKTSDMIGDIKKRGRYNFRLPNISPVEFNYKPISIDPYLLGVLLGDGSITDHGINISTNDDEIFDNIKHLDLHSSFVEYQRETITGVKKIKRIRLRKTLKNTLEMYGLFNKKSDNKFIPNDYLYNSLDVRISLLQGLMDTDGYIGKKGECEYTTVSEILAKNVRELVLSLGGTVSVKTKVPTYTYNGEKKTGKVSYKLTISFSNEIVPFKLFRKITRYQKRKKYVNKKFIKSIIFSHNEESLCIKVSNPDELYVTRDYVLTHNTTLLSLFANTAYNHGYNVLQIFFEDSTDNIKRKHYTIWSGVAPDDQPDNKEIVKDRVLEKSSSSKGCLDLLKLSSDSVTISEIKTRIRKRISEGKKIDLLLIDYVDCISPEKSQYGEEWKGEGSVMRSLESMSNEFNVVIWTATQGNRESISSEVVNSDQMGGSIKKAQIAHVILSIGKTIEQKEHNMATMTLLKSRIGKDGIIWQNCKFDNQYLVIDTESQTTLLGHKEEKQKDNATRAKEAFMRRNQMLNITE